MKELIRRLTEAYGPSGREEQVCQILRAELGPVATQLRVDALGNLIAVHAQSGSGRRVMLVAHMDEIGLIVSYVDRQGFLRFQPIGGVDPATLVGSRVQFSDGRIGVIAPEDRKAYRDKPDLSRLYIDVGAQSNEEVKSLLGEAVAFVRPFADLGRRLVAKALDDRIGCAILVETLRRLGSSPNQVYGVFSVQEEVGLRGAQTSAYGINPDLAIALDITLAADTPEAPKLAMKLGHGPCIKVMDSGMVAHPGVKDLMVRVAEREAIPFQLEVLHAGTTDAAATQTARAGVPSGCLSIACRYFHTPSEMVDSEDVENAVRLLVALLQEPLEF